MKYGELVNEAKAKILRRNHDWAVDKVVCLLEDVERAKSNLKFSQENLDQARTKLEEFLQQEVEEF